MLIDYVFSSEQSIYQVSIASLFYYLLCMLNEIFYDIVERS